MLSPLCPMDVLSHIIWSSYGTDLIFQINLIAPPLYVVTTQTLERQEGLAILNTAVSRIQELIEESGGVFEMKQAVSKELQGSQGC